MKRNMIDRCHLSPHLLDDLGFDQTGNPLQWSSFANEITRPSGFYRLVERNTTSTHRCCVEVLPDISNGPAC